MFKVGDLVFHVKSRTNYWVIGFGTIEATMETACIYRSNETGEVWIRPNAEMCDGRFVLARSR